MPFLLDTQFRSHPVIAEDGKKGKSVLSLCAPVYVVVCLGTPCQFSARTFYAGKPLGSREWERGQAPCKSGDGLMA